MGFSTNVLLPSSYKWYNVYSRSNRNQLGIDLLMNTSKKRLIVSMSIIWKSSSNLIIVFILFGDLRFTARHWTQILSTLELYFTRIVLPYYFRVCRTVSPPMLSDLFNESKVYLLQTWKIARSFVCDIKSPIEKSCSSTLRIGLAVFTVTIFKVSEYGWNNLFTLWFFLNIYV